MYSSQWLKIGRRLVHFSNLCQRYRALTWTALFSLRNRCLLHEYRRRFKLRFRRPACPSAYFRMPSIMHPFVITHVTETRSTCTTSPSNYGRRRRSAIEQQSVIRTTDPCPSGSVACVIRDTPNAGYQCINPLEELNGKSLVRCECSSC